jgi:hypothetical protein
MHRLRVSHCRENRPRQAVTINERETVSNLWCVATVADTVAGAGLDGVVPVGSEET